MPRAAPKPSKKTKAVAAPAVPHSRWNWVTLTAFVLSLVLVIARVAMEEMVRDSSIAAPGSTAAPAIPGPATTLALDWLCCLPALLVLARRAFDSRYALRSSKTYLPMFLLAAWTLISIAWADDKFLALVNASHWAAALVLIWSGSQLVHSWLRLRLVAAAGFGLLLLLLVQGYYYRFVDLPDFQRNWREHQAQMVHDRGMGLSDIDAEQIGKNIEGGSPTGFFLSHNTYAAILVLLMLLTAGIVVQRLSDGDGWGWAAGPILGITFGLAMLYLYVKSKTAYATPFIGFALIVLIRWRWDWISRNARKLYWSGVALFVLLVASVIIHGTRHGTLFHISLTFRWWYWVGAARLFLHHPWLGVGWANFGPHYLRWRLPQAAEQPTDPHNFLVRAFVELGVVGGVLMLAWILRLFWELTAGGSTPAEVQSQERSRFPAVPLVVGISCAAIIANGLFAIDWSPGSAWVILEAVKRVLFLLALIAGMCCVTIRSAQKQELDDRPAQWMVAGLLVALGLFLLHNLIDFSMFELGPMFLFALLCGSALGIRLPSPQPVSNRRPAQIGLALAGLLWLGAAVAVWPPIVDAASLRQEALLLTAKSSTGDENQPLDAGKLRQAEQKYEQAFQAVPIDGDSAFRAEQAGLMAREDPTLLRKLIDQAIAADPSSIRYRRARAVLEASLGDPGRSGEDYREILQRDPDNLDLRLEYAHVLEQQKEFAEAAKQFQTVLELNAKLAPDEIRRLDAAQVNQIRQSIATDAKHLP